MQSLNKAIQGAKGQLTLVSTSNLGCYNPPILDWQFFLNQMEMLEAQKRDKIPAETLMAWFNTLKSNGWTNEKLNKQVEIMLKNVTYGAVKIDDFFATVDRFSAEEMELKIISRINNLIRDGERLLNGKTISIELPPVQINLDAVRLAVYKRLKVYYNEEVEADAKTLIEEIISEVTQKLGYKKIQTVISGRESLKAKLGY